MQRFWGASGDFWQSQWDRILDTIGEDPVTLWVFGSTILTITVYWLFGGIYTLLDITNKPSALRRYKIQPGTNEPVNTSRLLKVCRNIIIMFMSQSISLINCSVNILNFLLNAQLFSTNGLNNIKP